MKIRWYPFNIYLAVALVAAVCGCRTSSEPNPKKLLSTLRLHLETNHDTTGFNEWVPVYRDHPYQVNVEKIPFLNESNISEARVVNVVGGFAMRIQFNHAGTGLLEQYTAANHEKRIVVFTQFGEELAQFRWLAAPTISHRIVDGVLIFTPDATREEAEQIVAGLNNVAEKTKSWIEKEWKQ